MGTKRKAEKAAGIDVSAKTLHLALEGRDQVDVFDNTREGHAKLIKLITKGGRTARIVVEATSTYHLDLALALEDHERCRVMVVNPRQSHHFQQARNVRAKTDTVDANTLRSYAKDMPFQEWKRPSKLALQLRSVARYVSQLTKARTILKAQIHAAKITDTADPWILEQQKLRLHQFDDDIKLATMHLQKLVGEVDEARAAVNVLVTIPGVGRATATRLVCEYMFLDRELTAAQITAWAGLDPKPRESGTSVNRRRSISKRGSARVRSMLYMPALAAIRCDGPWADLHARLKERGRPGKVGLTAVMRKMLVTSWAMYCSGTAWDATLASPRHPVLAAA